MKNNCVFLLLSVSVLFFFSCHKKKGATVLCNSYIIGTATVAGSATLPNETLATANANSGQVIKNYKDIIQVAYGNGPMGVYDHIHGRYYLYGSINANKPVLYALNTSDGVGNTLGYPVFDTANSGNYFNNLVCNSTTGKLYFFGNDYTVNGVYEITPNDTGFSERLIFNLATSVNVSSPVID